MLIREAKIEDAEAIFILAKEMVNYHHRLDPYYKSAEEYDNLEKEIWSWFDAKEGKIFVAETDGEIVGYARGGLEAAPLYARVKRVGVINDLLVLPSQRRHGAGEALARAIMQWFISKNVKELHLSVDARNRLGIKFWEKIGFKTISLKMKMNI